MGIQVQISGNTFVERATIFSRMSDDIHQGPGENLVSALICLQFCNEAVVANAITI